MAFMSNEAPFNTPYNGQNTIYEHIFLLIDSDEIRAQKLACLLTLAGYRAIVTQNIYQAFSRFIQEPFIVQAILIGQQEGTASTLFSRFFQRLTYELRYEPAVIALDLLNPLDGLPLAAEESTSPTAHIISPRNSILLTRIWQILPSTHIPLKVAESTMALETLPKMDFHPRVTRNKLSMSSHFHYQLKAAKQCIPPTQWDALLTDVGLAKFCKEENWPPLIDEFTIPPEYFSLLTRAVMFSNLQQPLQQVYHWSTQVEADTALKATLIFVMQQIPKVIGVDRTMRTLLNALMGEIDSRRGEKLTEWKRMKDGSFFFVFYSNVFVYGMLGKEQNTCLTWQYSFDLMLKLANQQQHWKIQEVECSNQTHTGHCVFQISPNKRK
jgi:hypothetical protein